MCEKEPEPCHEKGERRSYTHENKELRSCAIFTTAPHPQALDLI